VRVGGVIRSSVAILLIVLCLIPQRADAREAQQILREARREMGGDDWNGLRSLRLRFKLRANNLIGEGVAVWDLLHGRSASSFTLGPLQEAQGFDGANAWEQDSSGQVTLFSGGDTREQAVSQQFRTALAFWYKERGPPAELSGRVQLLRAHVKDVVQVAPKGGLTFEMWFDAQTHLLERIVEPNAHGAKMIYYDEYRALPTPGQPDFRGPMIPRKIRFSNGAQQYDREWSVESIERNPEITQKDFTPPRAPAPDFEFKDGAAQTQIAFKLINNHIYVPVRLNGRLFNLLCDTGGTNVVSPEVARALRLKPVGVAEVRGVGDRAESASFVKLKTVQVGGVKIGNQLFAVVPLSNMSKVEGVPFHGILGFEFFKRLIVRIDYDDSAIVLSAPDAWSPPKGAKVLSFAFNGHIPEIDGEIDGVAGKFDIDTGSRASLGLFAPFVERHDLLQKYRPSVKAVTGWGVGGPVRGVVARAKRLTLGGIVMNGIIVDMSAQEEGAFANSVTAGNVGAGLLKRFDLTFDYRGQRIAFEPNRFHNASAPYDRAGLWINRSEAGFVIEDMTPQGPAQLTGLKVGDRILAIDGKLAAAIDLSALRMRWSEEPPGAKFILTIRSTGRRKNVALILRDQI
jgi:hypothetical protein